MTALGEELEEHIRDLNAYVTQTRFSVYEKINEKIGQLLNIPFAIGYRRDVGWFILIMRRDDDPELYWSERRPRGS
jgi:hypothetical protein